MTILEITAMQSNENLVKEGKTNASDEFKVHSVTQNVCIVINQWLYVCTVINPTLIAVKSIINLL